MYPFLNMHILISHSPSCLNRDDMNMQKSAQFGGVRRVRISSQSLKRAIRTSDYYKQYLYSPSIRTKSLGKLVAKFQHELAVDFDAALVQKTFELVTEKEGIAIEMTADAVAPWSLEEMRRLCKIVQQHQELDDKKLSKLMKDETNSLRQALEHSLDIALSGRMMTSGLLSNIQGSLSLAHAITTHQVDADIDWFTAVDDLTQDDGEQGAGHLDTQEFGAGVFYRYGSLDLRQLQGNLGDADERKVLDIAAHMVHLLATVVPDAKQRTFAAHNLADLVMVSFGHIPVSGANAFEQPVQRANKEGGFLAPSIRAFENYIEKVRLGYALDEQHAVFSLQDTQLTPRLDSLPLLGSWIRQGGQV